MKYLIIGGNGLVGKRLQALLKNRGESYLATYRSNGAENQITCDILNVNDLKNAFEKAKPEVVINATNLAGGVNKCEFEAELAEKFHVEANKNITDLCLEFGAKYVMVSTDYVFDGSSPPYKEEDATNPLNKYGAFKLQAEKYMEAKLSNFIVARTTNVFGWDPLTKTPNYLMGLYFSLSKEEKCNAPSFLAGNPTYVDDLCEGILKLVEKNQNGIYHVVGSSNIDRYDWAVKFCDLLGFDKSLLNDIKVAPEGIVPRPLMSDLSAAKLESATSFVLSSVDDGLKRFKMEMDNSPT